MTEEIKQQNKIAAGITTAEIRMLYGTWQDRRLDRRERNDAAIDGQEKRQSERRKG